MMSALWQCYPLILATVVEAAFSPVDDGLDLEHFITRPELAAPRYMVAKHHPEAISPGYWFVAPYSNFAGKPDGLGQDWYPAQTGPLIYDGDGNLVWSGAGLFWHDNTFNFKPVSINGEPHLSLYVSESIAGDHIPGEITRGYGIVLNEHYEEIFRVQARGGVWPDVHEFDVLDDGRSAIITTMWQTNVTTPELGDHQRVVLGNGFQEIDLSSGKVLFSWNPFEHGVLVNESRNLKDMGMEAEYKPFDYFHINSVDKDRNGDYLVSARHTWTIYKVSGIDGSILWRLGGPLSDFPMDEDVEFLWQHDARTRFQNDTHTIISLFDNHGDDVGRYPGFNSSIPAAKVLLLDIAAIPMTAKLLRHLPRPDGKFSHLQGNVQQLGDDVAGSNLWVNWALGGYMSEYDGNDRLVLEARNVSPRRRSYRAFKFPWVGRPKEAPVLKAIPVGGDAAKKMSYAFFVSRNGATEVHSWSFLASDRKEGPFESLGSAKKRGFETSWTTATDAKWIYAQALDAQGVVLGNSASVLLQPYTNGSYVAGASGWDIESEDSPTIAPKIDLVVRRRDSFVSILSTFWLLSTVLVLIVLLAGVRPLLQGCFRHVSQAFRCTDKQMPL